MRATTGLGRAARALVAALSIGGMATLGLAACASDEGCASAKDCASGYRCEAHVCVLPPPPGRRDGGVAPDAQVPPDAGAEDASADAGGADAAPDAGVLPPDAGDAGAGDAGPAPGDAGPGGLSGYAYYHELTVSGVPTPFGGAAFEDSSGAVYATRTQRFPGLDGASCTLSVTRLQSGAPTGITAAQVRFRNDLGATRALLAVPGRPGTYALDPAATAGFFAPGNVSFETQSSGALGSLADFTAMLGAPGFLQATLPAVSPVAVAGGVHLEWVGLQSVLAVELYDAAREVVLGCTPPFGVSSYDLPADALQAWSDAGPGRPAALELRNDVVRAARVPREGGGTLPAAVRVSRGTRWDVVF